MLFILKNFEPLSSKIATREVRPKFIRNLRGVTLPHHVGGIPPAQEFQAHAPSPTHADPFPDVNIVDVKLLSDNLLVHFIARIWTQVCPKIQDIATDIEEAEREKIEEPLLLFDVGEVLLFII